MKHIRKITMLGLVLLLTGLFLPRAVSCQSIESARDKFLREEYDEAIAELEAVLQADSENIDAISLLNEVEQKSRQKRSAALTQRALREIENRQFEAAYEYLQQAILIDPENEQARRLFLSLYEVGEIEEESVAMAAEEATAAAVVPAPAGEVVAGTEEAVSLPPPPPQYDTALIKLSTSYTFANSNKLDYIDGRVSLIGARVEGRYYLDFWEKRVGASVDYTVYPLKTYGDSRIQFIVHRANIAARIRTYFFEEENSKLTVGAKLNYHFFTLQNLAEAGAYNFKQIYGPSIGIFVSDPVIYRFVKNDFFKDFGLEGEFNYLFLMGQGTAPSSLELYLGAYYNLDRYRFSLGYRLYSISKESINENYSDIEISAGYRF
jgi:tetratricopeptide (TPR) repeat protein